MNLRRLTRREQGFTLVELLVVVAISGILVALMVNGFRSVNGKWRALSLRSQASDNSRSARQFLEKLLSECYPELARDIDGQQALAFAGSTNEIRFLGPLSNRFGTDDIVQYRLYLTQKATLALDWRFDRIAPDGTATGTWVTTPVLAGIDSGSFWYFGAPTKADSPTWQSSWHRVDTLPLLIDVRLQRLGGSEPFELIIAPSITARFCNHSVRTQCSI